MMNCQSLEKVFNLFKNIAQRQGPKNIKGHDHNTALPLAQYFVNALKKEKEKLETCQYKDELVSQVHHKQTNNK